MRNRDAGDTCVARPPRSEQTARNACRSLFALKDAKDINADSTRNQGQATGNRSRRQQGQGDSRVRAVSRVKGTTGPGDQQVGRTTGQGDIRSGVRGKVAGRSGSERRDPRR